MNGDGIDRDFYGELDADQRERWLYNKIGQIYKTLDAMETAAGAQPAICEQKFYTRLQIKIAAAIGGAFLLGLGGLVLLKYPEAWKIISKLL